MLYYCSAIGRARPTRRSDCSDHSPNRPRRRPSRPTMNGIMHFLLLHKRGRQRGRLCTDLYCTYWRARGDHSPPAPRHCLLSLSLSFSSRVAGASFSFYRTHLTLEKRFVSFSRASRIGLRVCLRLLSRLSLSSFQLRLHYCHGLRRCYAGGNATKKIKRNVLLQKCSRNAELAMGKSHTHMFVFSILCK